MTNPFESMFKRCSNCEAPVKGRFELCYKCNIKLKSMRALKVKQQEVEHEKKKVLALSNPLLYCQVCYETHEICMCDYCDF